MQTEDDNAPVTIKKKNDKGQQSNDNVIVTLDKTELKKGEKSDGEDPKPRIVLTFRSDKSGAKNSNMKIVPNDDKHDDFSPRRSNRTRGKWEWSDENEASVSPKKEKISSQPVSENDETSDSSHTTSKRLTRRRSKDSCDNIVSNAITRKEKSFNEVAGPTQRLSRRIKPTAKILANEELRIGLESRNNARLGIQTEKGEESGVRTRRSTRPTQSETGASNKKNNKNIQEEIIIEDDDTNPGNNEDPNSVMKLKHLCELGLKAINPDSLDEDEEEEEDEEEDEMEIEEDEEDENEEDLEEDDMDDDSEEVISKLLEADEDSSEDFSCSIEAAQRNKPRRSTRRCFSYYRGQDSERNSPALEDDEQKEYCPPRKRNRSGRRAELQEEADQEDDTSRSRRLKSRSAKEEDVHSEPENEDNKSEPAGGDEGTEAACPEDESAVVATCFCEASSNVHVAPSEITEPVFCQAVECVEGVRVGCSHGAARVAGALLPLRRAGPRAPYLLLCKLHHALLSRHMCCPACGLFCTMGIFYQCSEGHLFHAECALPYGGAARGAPGCPHCGVRARRWTPRNAQCRRVTLRMRCGNKRIYLPDQREQCTPAYLSFSTLESSQLDQSPLIPEDLLPSTPLDLKQLCLKTENDDDMTVTSAAEELYEAILANETIEQLIPKIKSRAVVNEPLASKGGGAAAHAASARGHVAALYLLRCAGADIDLADNGLKTPLMVAVQELLDKSDDKKLKSKKTIDKDPEEDLKIKDEPDRDEEKEKPEPETEGEKEEGKDIVIDIKVEIDVEKASDEDLMKVIRYLIAAGCDVNAQGPDGMTALHMAAMHGGASVAEALLDGGADVDPRDQGGWTPLVWAAENCRTELVRLLLSRGADAASRDAEGNGAVHWCALAGDAHALRLLLTAAPHARDAANAHRDTPLHIAARQGHYACVVILLARGAKTDIENAAGELPVDVCSGACQSAVSLNMQMAEIVAPHTTKILSSDISNGREAFPVPCVNEVDDAPLPDDFTYVTEHVMPEPIAIDNTLATMQGCSCADGSCSSESCACCALSVRAWAARGRLPASFPYHDPPMLFECNQSCACRARSCGNMSVTRMLSRGSLGARVAVVRTRTRGWSLRAAAAAARGAPVAAYAGELLPLPAADARANDHYMFALDVKPDLLEQCADKTLLCVDAHRYGSAARFVNHSCRPNLAPVRVFTRHRDLRLPHVILYATRQLRPGDELTFDYGDKFWSVKSKWMKCECGTPECRYPEKTVDSDS